MLVQVELQQIGGHAALATLGARPTPRLPVSIATAMASFTIFFRMVTPFSSVPGRTVAVEYKPPARLGLFLILNI